MQDPLDLADTESCCLWIISRVYTRYFRAIIGHLRRRYLWQLMIIDRFLSSPTFTACNWRNNKALFACVLLWVVANFRWHSKLNMAFRLLAWSPLRVRVLIIDDLLLISSLLHLLVIQKQGVLMTLHQLRTLKCCCSLALGSMRMILWSYLILRMLRNQQLAILEVRNHNLGLVQKLTTNSLVKTIEGYL